MQVQQPEVQTAHGGPPLPSWGPRAGGNQVGALYCIFGAAVPLLHLWCCCPSTASLVLLSLYCIFGAAVPLLLLSFCCCCPLLLLHLCCWCCYCPSAAANASLLLLLLNLCCCYHSSAAAVPGSSDGAAAASAAVPSSFAFLGIDLQLTHHIAVGLLPLMLIISPILTLVPAACIPGPVAATGQSGVSSISSTEQQKTC
jgi:hypothetical protein